MGTTAYGDRVAGAVLGHALGDALGFQVERQGPDVTVPYALAWLGGGGTPEPRRDGHPVGQVSDDTQCVRATLRAVLSGGPGADAVASALSEIRDDMVGPGRTVRAGLDFLAGRHGPVEASIAARAASGAPSPPTNGAAMRAWAAALVPGGDVRARAALWAGITHDHPDAVAAAVVAAEAVALALAGCEPKGLLGALAVSAASDPARARIVDLAAGLSGAPVDAARDMAWEASGRDGKWYSVSPAAAPTVAWALRSFVLGGGATAASLADALSAGGDVDTVAGLAGAMCGAALGAGALPGGILDRLTDRGRWCRADLEALARQVASAYPGQESNGLNC